MPESRNPNLNSAAETLMLPLQGRDCRQLTLAEVEEAASVISNAFIDDPLCTFMLPFIHGREKTLRKFFRIYGELNVQRGSGYGSGTPLQGVAFWQFPKQAELSISIKAVGKFLPLIFSMYPIGYIRAKNVLNQIDVLHKKYALEPHFYLDNLGVLASARGKGVSSKLIRPFLELADAQKVAAYTDTVTRSNVAIYEHFGFQSMETVTIPKTGITVWAMRRPAKDG